MKWAAATVVALALACAGSAADHEELGDRSYAVGAYRDALAEYQLGLKAHPGRAGLHAKTAAAALHTQDFSLAGAEYAALARDDRSRAEEAAGGLERVIRGALRANDRAAVAIALAALRELMPARPLGRYARLVALEAAERGDAAEALALLPTAAAAASDARAADSLLFVYGTAALRARDCRTATAVFEGLLRRGRAPEVAEGAREGLGLCALVQGQDALNGGQPGVAEDWFRRATAPGASPDVTRGAFLGLGDVRLAQGDLVGALVAYQQALAGGPPGDTIAQRAREKLNSLGRPEEAPSTR